MSDENWDPGRRAALALRATQAESFEAPHPVRSDEDRENVLAAYHAGCEATVVQIIERLRRDAQFWPEIGRVGDLVESEFGDGTADPRSRGRPSRP